MPTFQRADVTLYWEEHGDGYPLLAFAAGGMRSSVDFWKRSPFDPRTALSDSFRVLAMDQRNAGRSTAAVRASDGWPRYTQDHLALLDHLGIERCHLLGGCIGSSYCLALIEAAPDRVSAAVLQNPIGLYQNRDAFFAMFDGWAADLKERQAGLDDSTLETFRDSMYGGDFVFSVSRTFVRSCTTPLLVLAGNDLYHPAPIAREIAELAPDAELVLDWKDSDLVPATVERVRGFLERHRPG